MAETAKSSRIQTTIDLKEPGRLAGDIMLRWSDNECPLGYHASPIMKIGDAPSPSILLIAGVHGDEFEGPAALMQLFHSIRDEDIAGRITMLPAFNMPAVGASSRVSPLDGQNLNRAFPGDPDGGPTAMLAHFLESCLMPGCDAVIDLHSGGKASVFHPCSLASRTDSGELFRRNMELARTFGLEHIWVLGSFSDDRSVNAAAARCGIPMIATELGGGGGVDPAIVERTVSGIKRCLSSLGVLKEDIPSDVRRDFSEIEIRSAAQNLYSPGRGIFQRCFAEGETVEAGQLAGWLHFVEEPERPPCRIEFKEPGFALARTNRGMVRRGDMLAMIGSRVRD